MLFNSYEFIVFLPVVAIVYYLLPLSFRQIWLLAASFFFYMFWNPKYALLMTFSIVTTFFSGLLIKRCRSNLSVKRIILIAAILINLLILFIFKYFNFFVSNVNMGLGILDIDLSFPMLNIILPVGISFYTFQALGYIVDVYRDDIEAERSFVCYALFVSFFPQLVAGPIERSGNLLIQIKSIKKVSLLNYENIANGAILVVWGLFLKMVIADRVAIFVDAVFEEFYMFGTVELLLAAIGFAIQIYCDFASYSIIAIGAAQILGIQMMENFDTPYFSRSIKEFWRRWHISLSTWFRDYLYIPLGGSRCSETRKNVNLMITFIISGFWHGASWNFVIWGALHGLYQVVGGGIQNLREKTIRRLNIKTECFSWKLLQIMTTFILVDFAWIFFRADSLHQSLEYIICLFTGFNPWVLFDESIFLIGLARIEWNILLVSVGILLLVDLIKRLRNKRIDEFLSEQNMWFRWCIIIGLVCAIFLFGNYGPNVAAEQFIYFQF